MNVATSEYDFFQPFSMLIFYFLCICLTLRRSLRTFHMEDAVAYVHNEYCMVSDQHGLPPLRDAPLKLIRNWVSAKSARKWGGKWMLIALKCWTCRCLLLNESGNQRSWSYCSIGDEGFHSEVQVLDMNTNFGHVSRPPSICPGHPPV